MAALQKKLIDGLVKDFVVVVVVAVQVGEQQMIGRFVVVVFVVVVVVALQVGCHVLAEEPEL